VELASLLGISPKTVYVLAGAGIIPCHKIFITGTERPRVRFSDDDVRAILANSAVPVKPRARLGRPPKPKVQPTVPTTAKTAKPRRGAKPKGEKAASPLPSRREGGKERLN
jgi:hypothetical protein